MAAVVVGADLAGKLTDALHDSVRAAVNAAALAITTDARRRVQAAIGAEQRLSHVTATRRNGKTSRLRDTTRAAGGARINPYYREANSDTNPVALVAARGPAHYIEHDRTGGYLVKPLRAPVRSNVSRQRAIELFGPAGARIDLEVEQSRAAHPALSTPQGPRASARPGSITSPLRPIGRAFDAATTTVGDLAAREMQSRVEANLRSLSRRG